MSPVDPWDLFNLKKIFTMIFALAIIQVVGSVTTHFLGARTGAILTGFFGGLVSSTATTASLARRSQFDRNTDGSKEMLIFLAATAAMLCEALTLVILGTSDVHFSNLLIFIGPLLATLGMIFFRYQRLKDRSALLDRSPFHILPILKLAFFIIGILALSKLGQNLFGNRGLIVLTFLVSLFEIHGSVIANVQLHESETLSISFLSSLLAISVCASYFSKLFLISTLGSSKLRSQAIQSTSILLGALVIGWIVTSQL